MRFHSHNYHKSGFIEKLASSFSAIEYMIGFRRRHRRVFNIVITLLVVGIALIVILLLNPGIIRNIQASTSGNASGASDNSVISYNQPVVVDISNQIDHVKTADGHFSSTIRYTFSTDFLVEDGVTRGDTCTITLSIIYQSKSGDIQGLGPNGDTVELIAGETAHLETEIINSSGYISVDDIIGFDFK